MTDRTEPPQGEGPIRVPTDEDMCRYRRRAHEIALWAEAQAPTWEQDGRLSPQLFAKLGGADLFWERWSFGPRGGLCLANALVQELAVVHWGAAAAVSIHSEMFVHALTMVHGDEPVLRKPACDGSVIGCVALAEPNGGLDLDSLRTTVEHHGDSLRVTGAKHYVVNGSVASHALVVCKDPDGASLVLVDLHAPGVSVSGIRNIGTQAIGMADITFDGVEVPAADVLAQGGRGVVILTSLLDLERLAVSAATLAATQRLLRLDRALLREEHSGTRLIDQQERRHQLGVLWSCYEAGEGMASSVHETILRGDFGHHRIAELTVATTVMTEHVVGEAMALLEPRSYREDFPLAHLAADIHLARLYAGTAERMGEIVGSSLDCSDPEAEALLARYFPRPKM